MPETTTKKPQGFQKGHGRLRGLPSEDEKKKLSEARKGSGNPFWKGGPKVKTVCLNCGKDRYDYKSHKYCSKSCAVTSPERRELQRKNAIGNKAHWKGDEVGYFGLHSWMQRKYGKPDTCEHCGVKGQRHHWANKTGQYKRDRSDWLRLCPSCHTKYDRRDPKRKAKI